MTVRGEFWWPFAGRTHDRLWGVSHGRRHKHPHANWKQLRRRHLPRWWPTDGDTTLFDPNRVPVRYYRYRGTTIPAPWPQEASPSAG
jgi:hypothetical protein